MKSLCFLTTSFQPPHYINAYSSKIYLENLIKKKITLFKVKNKFFILDFFIFFIKILLLGKIFNNEKILFLKYKSCQIGRYVISSHERRKVNGENFFFKRINILKDIFLGINIINTINSISDNIIGIYVDHGQFLNGLYIESIAKKKKIVSTYNYPKGITLIDFKKSTNSSKCSFEGILKIYKKKIKFNKNIVNRKIKKTLLSPVVIPWLKKAKFVNLKNENFKKYTHVIYAHSFSDDQLMWGVDGFLNMYDWLIFTIDNLLKNNNYIIVKAHPNFYLPINSAAVKYDKKIFFEIKKRYSSKQLFFLDSPIKNYDLLKSINSKTVLISHHGTAILEGLFMNYKVISSSATMWEKKFKITNSWNDKSEYLNLLNKSWHDLKFCKNKDFFELCYLLYCNPYNLYGNKFWLKVLKEKLALNLNDNDQILRNTILKLTSSENVEKISQELSQCIESEM